MIGYVGIDPGMSGALVLLTDDGGMAVADMPVHEIDGKNRIDLYQLGALLRSWGSIAEVKRATIERVNAMPPLHGGKVCPKCKQGRKAGAASSFAFGFAAGAAQMAVAAEGWHMVLVVPQVWKKVYGLRGGVEHKDDSRQRASEIFPKHAHLWARKKDSGRAEAALIAHYGSRLP